jgi:hypothetical protein
VHIFKVAYLTTLAVSRLYSTDDRMINECGDFGGIRKGRGNRSTPRSTLSAKNPTLPDVVSTSCRHGGVDAMYSGTEY